MSNPFEGQKFDSVNVLASYIPSPGLWMLSVDGFKGGDGSADPENIRHEAIVAEKDDLAIIKRRIGELLADLLVAGVSPEVIALIDGNEWMTLRVRGMEQADAVGR